MQQAHLSAISPILPDFGRRCQTLQKGFLLKEEHVSSKSAANFGAVRLIKQNKPITSFQLSQRHQSSISGTKKSDHTGSDNNVSSNGSESSFLKSNVAKSSYKPVNLAYISYEKKTQNKVRTIHCKLIKLTFFGKMAKCPFYPI